MAGVKAGTRADVVRAALCDKKFRTAAEVAEITGLETAEVSSVLSDMDLKQGWLETERIRHNGGPLRKAYRFRTVEESVVDVTSEQVFRWTCPKCKAAQETRRFKRERTPRFVQCDSCSLRYQTKVRAL